MYKKENMVQLLTASLMYFIIIYFSLRLFIEPLLSREKFVVVYTLFSIYVLGLIFFTKKLHRSDSLILLFCFTLLIRYFFQIILMPTSFFTIISLFQYLFPVLFIFIARIVEDKIQERMENFMVLIALFSVTFGLLNAVFEFVPQFIYTTDRTIVSDLVVNRAGSLMGPSLATGGLCGLGGAFLISSRRFPLFIKIVFLSIFMLVEIKTYSRGGLIFFVIILFVISVGFLKQLTKQKRTTYLLIGAGAAFVLFMAIIVMAAFRVANMDIYMQRYVFDLFSKKETGNSQRLTSMLMAINKIMINPLLGIGYGHLGSSAVEREIIGSFSPENYYLKLGAEAGIINLLLFMIISLKSLRMSTKIQSPFKYKYLGIIIGFLVWSIFLQTLENDFFAIFYWYSIGQLQKLYINEIEVRRNDVNNENTLHYACRLGLD